MVPARPLVLRALAGGSCIFFLQRLRGRLLPGSNEGGGEGTLAPAAIMVRTLQTARKSYDPFGQEVARPPAEAALCPVCQLPLDGLEESVRTRHVNDCLDYGAGEAPRLSEPLPLPSSVLGRSSIDGFPSEVSPKHEREATQPVERPSIPEASGMALDVVAHEQDWRERSFGKSDGNSASSTSPSPILHSPTPDNSVPPSGVLRSHRSDPAPCGHGALPGPASRGDRSPGRLLDLLGPTAFNGIAS